MEQFHFNLVRWYEEKKRNLPWRETKNPYLIWLSEIILQQTRVDQGLKYFISFKTNFPTIQDLAKASEMEVLNLWKGLGYYSRARNLHGTAIYIAENLNGKFPDNYDDIIKLKGIGSYTAAAISSFAFNEAKAVLDGNVYRVLSRVFGISTPINSTQGKKEFQALADEILDKANPGTHNQAIMEFGAMQCVPINPNCENCPLNFMCVAFSEKKVKQFPIKIGKTKISNKYFVFTIIKENGKILLEKRTDSGIWKNLYQFPLTEFESLDEKSAFLNNRAYDFISNEIKHILSHQHLHCTFVISREKAQIHPPNYSWVSVKEIDEFPIPRVIERFIEENHLLIFNT
jgi:A/G-specific adenine glycosylase